MYNEIVLDHFSNPRNTGSFEAPDGIGRSGNSIDGDKITIYIKINNGILDIVRFKTFGCGAAIAASSMLTILATGKSLEEARKITNEDVAEALGGLPPQKLRCSNIAADALQNAINDYLRESNSGLYEGKNFSENQPQEEHSADKGLTDTKQIQRYMRHIIMPAIGGKGQKKLLETSILICAPSAASCDVLLDYMAASGLGHLYCRFENDNGSEDVFAHLRDLNPDVDIQLIKANDLPDKQNSGAARKADFNVIIGDSDFLSRISRAFVEREVSDFSPTFIAAVNPWVGNLILCKDTISLKDFFSLLPEKGDFPYDAKEHRDFNQLGMSMSYMFIGILTVIELIKACLNIGNNLEGMVEVNLLEGTLANNVTTSDYRLCSLQDSAVVSCLDIDNIKQKLAQGKVLIVGTGGLGSPAALALTKAGIGNLGLIDFDKVELSNLNRQVLHSTSKIGTLKVESARRALKIINEEVSIKLYATAFSRENALDIIGDYDIVVDGLDNLPTRYLLNDACFFAKKPLVEAGVLAFYGQVTAIIPGEGPCYRCIFPESEEHRTAPGCSETGILGPVPGLIGILQAVEVIKMLMGMNTVLKGELLMYDALETEFNVVTFQWNNKCVLCGEAPSIEELGDYGFVCKDKS